MSAHHAASSPHNNRTSLPHTQLEPTVADFRNEMSALARGLGLSLKTPAAYDRKKGGDPVQVCTRVHHKSTLAKGSYGSYPIMCVPNHV